MSEDVSLQGPLDDERWEEVYRASGPTVHAICRRHRLQAADANDVEQESLRRLARCLSAGKRIDCLPAWLRTTVTRQIDSYRRRAERQLPADLSGHAPPAAGTETEQPLRAVERDETKELVRGFKKSLPDPLEEVIEDRLQHENGGALQRAERLGLTRATFRVRLNEGLRRMRLALRWLGYGLDRRR